MWELMPVHDSPNLELLTAECGGGAGMYELDVAQVAKTCLNTLEDRGYEVVQSSDFRALEPEILALPGKDLISPNFLSDLNDFSDGNAFWIGLRVEDRLVAVLAARLDSTGADGLGPFLQRNLSRLYCGGAVAVEKQSRAMAGIGGDLIYFGDLFIRKENRGSRAVLMCLVQLMHCLSFLKWPSATHVYAFHRAEDVLDGRADEYGFGNRWPRAQVWIDPPSYRGDREYLSTLSRRDFEIRVATFSDAPWLLVDMPDRRRSEKTTDSSKS